MKISIVTVVYNGEAFIEDAVRSVLEQDYPDLEYVVVDGASKDGTMAILERYRDRISVLVSEPDKGIYDAMNKGIGLATGDVIGILNADDMYADPGVISRVAAHLAESGASSLYGDLVYFPHGEPERVVRYYDASGFDRKRFRQGDMPPHPTFFVKRELYDQFGLFDTQYRICADFDLMVRMLYKGQASTSYLPMVMVKMRTGGVSTSGLKATMRVNREMYASLRSHGVSTSMLRIYSKYFRKVWQLIRRPAKAAFQ